MYSTNGFWLGLRTGRGNTRTYYKGPVLFGTVLIGVLILMLVGALPAWLHSRRWGYYPSGGLGLILAILVIPLLLGQL